MCGAPAKQLDLELPDAAADLQDRSARNPARGDEVDNPLRRRGQAPSLIALRLTSREAAGEDRLIVVRIAALGHGVSIPQHALGNPGDSGFFGNSVAALDKGL